MSEYTTSGKKNRHGAGVKRKARAERMRSYDDLVGYRGGGAPSKHRSGHREIGSAEPMRDWNMLAAYRGGAGTPAPTGTRDFLSGLPALRATQTGEGLSDSVHSPLGAVHAPKPHSDAIPVGGLLAGSGLKLTPDQFAGLKTSYGMLTAPGASKPLSVDDVVALGMAKIPTPPTVHAATIDIGAIQRLYDQGKAAANKEAAAGRTDLQGLNAQAVRQLDLSKVAQEANTRASVTAQTSAAANNALGAAGDFQGSVDMLRGNGVDPALVEQLVGAQKQAAAQASAHGTLGTDLTTANNATAMQVHGQQVFDNKQMDLNANRQLDRALVETLLGLDSKKTSAVADATAQNAAAQQQADQANYANQMQALQDRTALRQQLLDRAATEGALGAPTRDAALQAAKAHGKSGEYFADVLGRTLQAAADSGEVATIDGFKTNLNKYFTELAKAKGFDSQPWNVDWYTNLARDYFRTDPTVIDGEAAKRYLAMLG